MVHALWCDACSKASASIEVERDLSLLLYTTARVSSTVKYDFGYS